MQHYSKDIFNAALSAATAPLLAQIAALNQAIDEAKITSHIGVFNNGDDPAKAINDLMLWSQGVGEYFATEKSNERIAQLEAQLAEAKKDADRLDIRLFDSQWANVVNHDRCYSGYSVEDAVFKAVSLTEIYMAKNFHDRKWPAKLAPAIDAAIAQEHKL